MYVILKEQKIQETCGRWARRVFLIKWPVSGNKGEVFFYEVASEWKYKDGVSKVASQWKFKYGVSNKVASEWKYKDGVSNKVASEWKYKDGVSNKVASQWKFKYGVSNKVASQWKYKVGVSNKVASEWKYKVGVSYKMASECKNRFYQHIDIPTRGNNTLDRVYTNIRDAYRAVPHPHLGLSDHISVMLVPAYHPPLRRSRPTQKTITVWPSDADAVLQDCFGCTDWQVFREAAESEGELDLEDYTSAVLGYISKCVEDVTTTKTVTCYPNQKPWLNGEVRSLLKARDAAFRSGDAQELRRARRELTAGVKRAKAAYALKIQGHFSSQDPRSMWRGIKCITDYKTRDAQCSKDPSLPEALNKFYARFEDPDTPPSIRLTPTPGEVPLSVTPAEVRRTLRRINPRKSAGPDNIPGRVLRECADQISEVLADIFNVSLTQAAVPTCLKTATIIPVPKSSTVTGLNDYRPIALTPIVTKCFERLVMTHIKATIDVTVDPHQYAYRRNRSTDDDAISSVVHTALTHLEQKDSYVRMLFVDFTSAFNTMIPQTLTDKLSSLGLRSSLCNWVLDFLTNRPQSVRIHNLSSSTTILSTGSPQGCVLSPLLFTLLTYDCSPIHSGCHIVKFADDTAVVGCITNSDESGYRQEVEHLEGWCRKNNLCINVKMIVNFRRGRHAHLPLHDRGSAVEVVSNYRYLGVHLSNNLTWSNNTSSLVRKAHQRLYFLRRLRRAGLGSSVLTSFYRCVVESVLCSSINVWHGSCSAADRKALQRVVKAAQRSVGVSLPTTTDIYTSRCRKRATCIMKDPTHPAHSLFVPLPSGRRLRSIKCRTNRLRNSFIPEAFCHIFAEHSGDDSGLQEKSPSPSSPHRPRQKVMAVKSHRFLDTTITKDLKWDCYINSIIKNLH
ncbi:hypothetical protein NFI96_002438 [Prochilodus magdalenae]|nr:hypothetical protein NFI96_002438 [Prochilodus magdalenae]